MYFNYKIIIRIVGMISFIIGIAMIPSLLLAYYYGEKEAGEAFIKSILLAVSIGLIIRLTIFPASSQIKIRDGFLIAAICWFAASALGAFPFLLSGVSQSYLDAFFESVSGFTTTGTTIINNYQEIPKAVIFWRSLSHWLGAMGILVLAISLLPALGIGGLMIASVETPGLTIEKTKARISDSAKMLYLVYITFTLAEVALLKIGGLSYFDAFTHTFTSISTGGTLIYANGIQHFNSLYVEIVISLFHIIASINFVLLYKLFKGKWREFIKDYELRTFIAILFVATILISFNLWFSNSYEDLASSIRHAFFQSASFLSTAGNATSDFTIWPSFSQMILLCLMLIGGCSVSTAGSLKVIRVMIVFKLIVRGMYKRLHPNAVVGIKIGTRVIPSEIVSKVSSFTILYLTVLVFSSILLSLENHDLLTTISAVVSTMSNTGIGLGIIGHDGNFRIFSEFSRLYLSFLMIAGRLEFIAVIMLLSPSFWKAE